MHNYCINKLLNIEDIFVKKIIHSDNSVKLFTETKASPHICPVCGASTSKIHDYRLQKIKDLPFQTKHCFLILKKRRYSCSCGKRFYEKYSFLPKYFHRTSRLTAFIAKHLHNTESTKSVAVKSNISATTVCTILDSIRYQRPTLKDSIYIDEFLGNARTIPCKILCL